MDEFRWCVSCGADCYPEDPEHKTDCPETTGLYPADVGQRCCRCHEPVDVYVQVGWGVVVEECCVGCGFDALVT